MKNILVLTILLLQYANSTFGQKNDTFSVYFEKNEAKLNTKGMERINQLVADKALTRGQKLMLQGYTDYLGTNGHNDSLSVFRANNVRDHLLTIGFDKKDITMCEGMGKIDRKPVDENGYSMDRKVQIIAVRHETGISTLHKAENVTIKEDQSGLNIEMVKVTGNGFNFAIGKYDITLEQWRAVMGKNPQYVTHCDSCPVTQISWNDVQIFLRKLDSMTGKNYRLPTEAEWEYAARGGKRSHNYMYAGSNDIDSVAWYCDNSYNKAHPIGVHPVGRKQPNELGIYDMSGHVWQWCSNFYAPKDGHRTIRGGAWFLKPVYCRVTSRNFAMPDERNDAIGFRVACDL